MNSRELLTRKRQGSLKVYLGYAAGVGKTFAMLQEAHRLRQEGFDAVIGYGSRIAARRPWPSWRAWRSCRPCSCWARRC